MRQRTPEQLQAIVEKMQELMTERDGLADTSIRARVIDRKLGWYRGRVPADMIPAKVNAIFEAGETRRPASESDTETLEEPHPAPPDRFLPGVPGPDIERILDAAPGKELETKFDRPTSSAALAVNVFGFFLHRPDDLPPVPGLEYAGWPARSFALERTIRFPGPAADIPSPIASWSLALHWSPSNASGSSRSAAATTLASATLSGDLSGEIGWSVTNTSATCSVGTGTCTRS